MEVLDIEAPANILALAAEVTRMIWRLSGWSSTNKMRVHEQCDRWRFRHQLGYQIHTLAA
jgi:hypothetical protein